MYDMSMKKDSPFYTSGAQFCEDREYEEKAKKKDSPFYTSGAQFCEDREDKE